MSVTVFSQAEETRRKEKGGRKEKGRKGGNGRGRSPLQYTLEQDEMSAHRRKPRKERGRNRKKVGKELYFSIQLSTTKAM